MAAMSGSNQSSSGSATNIFPHPTEENSSSCVFLVRPVLTLLIETTTFLRASHSRQRSGGSSRAPGSALADRIERRREEPVFCKGVFAQVAIAPVGGGRLGV